MLLQEVSCRERERGGESKRGGGGGRACKLMLLHWCIGSNTNNSKWELVHQDYTDHLVHSGLTLVNWYNWTCQWPSNAGQLAIMPVPGRAGGSELRLLISSALRD